jgi:type 1 glutamine amidotransferase
MMKILSVFFPVVAFFTILGISVSGEAPKKKHVKPLRALLITGGCCHDYNKQKLIIPAGISERANVEWTIVQEGGTSRDHRVSVYAKPGWAEGYDVIVHNECFGGVTDVEFIEAIAQVHKEGTPGVTLHCSTHSYRNAKTDEWRKFLGVSSFNHGRHNPIEIINTGKDHPVMSGFPDKWTTPKGELYNIEKVWPNTIELAVGKAGGKENLCVWVNQYGRGRMFGTTIGHHNETMAEDVYLDLVTRGLLWACGKLGKDGKPLIGYAASQ